MTTPVDAPQNQEGPIESKMHRLRIGDVVEFDDLSTWPPTKLEGPIVGFANVEGSYINCQLTNPENGVVSEHTLTEDEVHRVS